MPADQDSEATTENERGARVPPGGAGARAHAFCWKEPIIEFFHSFPFLRGNMRQRQLFYVSALTAAISALMYPNE